MQRKIPLQTPTNQSAVEPFSAFDWIDNARNEGLEVEWLVQTDERGQRGGMYLSEDGGVIGGRLGGQINFSTPETEANRAAVVAALRLEHRLRVEYAEAADAPDFTASKAAGLLKKWHAEANALDEQWQAQDGRERQATLDACRLIREQADKLEQHLPALGGDTAADALAQLALLPGLLSFICEHASLRNQGGDPMGEANRAIEAAISAAEAASGLTVLDLMGSYYVPFRH
ncbi:MAG: hypothetical protein ACYC1L_18505 [Alphaproteobacteria bacterium]